MNPATTLAARTGLSVPQLRRLIPCDVGALDLPDLALQGGRAIEAARRAGPLPLRPPRGSCERFRRGVVHLLRQTLHPEVLGMVDVDLLLGLGTGMTAWLPEPGAMRQVLYNFLLVVETVGWTKPGWLDRLRTFPAAPADDRPQVGLALLTEVRLMPHEAPGPRISLFPERLGEVMPRGDRAMTSRESIMPAFTLSEQTKAQLVWLIHETGTSPDRAVTTLIKIFVILRKEYEFENLQVVVALRDQCDAVDLSVADLRAFLEQTHALKAQGLAVSDAGAALAVAEQLAGAGLTLDRARAVADLIEALRNANIDLTVPEQLRQTLDDYRALGYAPEIIDRLAALDGALRSLGLTPDDLEPRLRHLERLNALGLDPEATDTLANALEATGLREEQRAEAMRRLPEIAARQVEVDELRALQEQLRQALERLTAELAKARQALQRARKRLASLSAQDRRLTERIAALQQECIKLQDSIVAGRALETFLVTSTDLSHPFWTRIAQLRALKERRPSPLAGAEALFTEATKQEIVKFLARITATPTTPPPGEGA